MGFPGQISNAIIEIKDKDAIALTNMITSLQNLGCQALKISIYNNTEQEQILKIVLELLEGSAITSLEVNLSFYEDAEVNLLQLLTDYPRLLKVFVFAAPSSYLSEKANDKLGKLSNIMFTTKALNIKSCGQIHWAYFTTNIAHFTESLVHNTCINRKIAIDAEGNIKNCPSMTENFGNIKDTALEEAINKPGFKKYWNITKDEIVKCKDCEFRHICTDCRAYLENPEDIHSAPLKCGYDPYTCEWEEWSTNPLKQKAIKYYGMEKK